jgi:hypothetical protein
LGLWDVSACRDEAPGSEWIQERQLDRKSLAMEIEFSWDYLFIIDRSGLGKYAMVKESDS